MGWGVSGRVVNEDWHIAGRFGGWGVEFLAL
jgi:hypothetical protein